MKQNPALDPFCDRDDFRAGPHLHAVRVIWRRDATSRPPTRAKPPNTRVGGSETAEAVNRKLGPKEFVFQRIPKSVAEVEGGVGCKGDGDRVRAHGSAQCQDQYRDPDGRHRIEERRHKLAMLSPSMVRQAHRAGEPSPTPDTREATGTWSIHRFGEVRG
jgi:hypothetical protein